MIKSFFLTLFKKIFLKQSNIFRLSLICSIIFHFFYLYNTHFLFNDFPKKSPVNNNAYQKISRIRIKIKIKERNKIKNQIVDSELNHKDLVVKTKFLGKFNNKVKKEMLARQVGSFKLKSQNKKSMLKKQYKIKQQNRKRSNAQLSFKKLAVGFFKLNHNTLTVIKKMSKVKNIKTEKIKNGQKRLFKHGQSNDYIKDIALGDTTQLNTREFKYYSYYNRIKIKLERHWGKTVEDKMTELYHNKVRSISSVPKITLLKVILDKKGTIVKIYLEGSSGVSIFDNAAIKTFNMAGPFPNPPSSMLKNGYALIEWGFVIKS